MAYHHGNLREALLERAAEVITERGVEAVSLRGLARDLGVSHAAPSRHFADRAALLREVAKVGFRRSVEAMLAGADDVGADPVARYRALGRSYVRFAVEDPAYFRAMNHPEVRAHADDELAELRRGFMATLRDGVVAAQRAGWQPDADPEALTAFSIAAASGAADLLGDARWGRTLGVEDAAARDALADAVLDLVVQRTHTAALPSAHGDTPQPGRETDTRRAS